MGVLVIKAVFLVSVLNTKAEKNVCLRINVYSTKEAEDVTARVLVHNGFALLRYLST